MTQATKKPNAKPAAVDTPAAIAAQTEQFFTTASTALDLVTTRSRAAMEQSANALDAITDLTRGNIEALIASSRIASAGIQDITRGLVDFTRAQVEQTTGAARDLAQAKTPAEAMEMQRAFAKVQFSTALSEAARLTQAMIATMNEARAPLQARASSIAQAATAAKGD